MESRFREVRPGGEGGDDVRGKEVSLDDDHLGLILRLKRRGGSTVRFEEV